MSTKQLITLGPIRTWQQMLRDKENLERQLAGVSTEINKYANDLLEMINAELKEFAIATNSLYTENNTNRFRYDINFDYAKDVIEPYPTSYSYSCFVEFTDKDSCRKAIEKFHDDLKEYFDIKVYFRRR